MQTPQRESDVEDFLVKMVKFAGGEIRKVKWIGRDKAPDRLVMLPPLGGFGGRPPLTLWVEVKHPKTGHLFPKNAHEEAQHREHERMRAMGQTVLVVWTYEQVMEIVK